MDRYAILTMQIQAALGLPYRWGGASPLTGFDCSGLFIWLHQSVGTFARGFDASAQGLRVKLPKRAVGPKFGDAVFFGKGDQATHVGFFLGDGLMLEAGGGSSTTLTRADAEKQGACVRIRPVTDRGDLLGYGIGLT